MLKTLNKLWSEYKDSNLGPPGPKPGALPDCATLRTCRIIHLKNVCSFKKLTYFLMTCLNNLALLTRPVNYSTTFFLNF
jgi:hypothetical protein